MARVAADVRAGEPELLAQEVDEQQPRLDLVRDLLAVDGDGDLVRCRLRLCDHDASTSFALRRPRAVKMRTTLRLYSSVPRTSDCGSAAAAASRAASSIASSSSACAVSASSASAARMFVGPTPVSAMPACSTVPFDIATCTATPAVAKSPTLRSSFRYVPPARTGMGTRPSVISSFGCNAVRNGP